MNHFTLFAHGESFDVDTYLAKTTLRFDHVWRLGHQRRYSCVESRHPTSGVEKVLGDGSTIPVHEQQNIAVEFLSTHRTALLELANYPGVDTFVLGLHYEIVLEEGIIGLCMGPSAQLMKHALDLRIRPNFYVVLDRHSDRNGVA
jgi:hypothetical protein